MIHYMGGGVIDEYGVYDFVKVRFDDSDTPYWYITDFDVSEGERVSAPFGRLGTSRVATVVRVEKNVSAQTAPIPVKHVKRLIAKLD